MKNLFLLIVILASGCAAPRRVGHGNEKVQARVSEAQIRKIVGALSPSPVKTWNWTKPGEAIVADLENGGVIYVGKIRSEKEPSPAKP